MAICSVIKGVGHYVPHRIVTNADLSLLMNTSDEWITERTGIKERRFVDEGTSTSDLALAAIENLQIKLGEKSLNNVDLIIAATLSPDYYFPGIGTLIQNCLGLPTIPALDIRVQCSGFVYGLSVIDAFIRSGQYRKVLFVCAEVQSLALELNDRGRDMAVLFGDGAGALLIEAVNSDRAPAFDNKQRGIMASVLGSDGSGAEALCVKSPGTATKGFLSEEAFISGLWHPKMDGRAVFKQAVTRMCETALGLLKTAGVSPDDLDLLLPHQANLRINEAVREKLRLPSRKVFNNIQRYGNTTAATIPLLLSEASEQGILKKGDLIMTLAFGAGFTWGANLIRF